MPTPSPKDLKALLKILRESGVTSFKTQEIEIVMGDAPTQVDNYTGPNLMAADDAQLDPYANFPNEFLTPEQLAYYAHGGKPDTDPFRLKKSQDPEESN